MPQISKLKIAVFLGNNHLFPLRDAAPFSAHALFFFKNKNIPAAEYDLILAHAHLINADWIRERSGKVVLVDRIDGAQMGAARSYVDMPDVLGVLKSYCLRDEKENNRVGGRYSCYLLTGENREVMQVKRLDKIRLVWGFGAVARYGKIKNLAWTTGAGLLPAMFAGVVKRPVSAGITLHRRLAVDAVRRVGGFSMAGNKISSQEYFKHMLGARCAVSPWGLGEACYRDYEALWLGRVLIKPDSRHVKADPDIFADPLVCIPCKYDFSDLNEVIKNAHLTSKELKRNRKIAERAFCRRTIAKNFDAAIQGILNHAAN
jgi:hypothetical protein